MSMNLPEDILTGEILMKLHFKTLCRMKCVCNRWCKAIRSPNFTKLYQKRNSSILRNGVLISLGNFLSLSTVSLHPHYTPLTQLYSRRDRIPKRSPDSTVSEMLRWIVVVGSSSGLVCVLENRRTLYLLNITTRESFMVPSDPDYEGKLYGFGYASSDFKIVKISKCHSVRVYSLRNNSWKQVTDLFPVRVHWFLSDTSVSVNGNIYWYFSDREVKLGSRILWFDLVQEKFQIVSLPDVDLEEGETVFVMSLTVLKGLLCANLRYRDGESHLWLMSEDSWFRFATIPEYQNEADFHPLSVSGDTLILDANSESFFEFNFVKHQFRPLKLRDQAFRTSFHALAYEGSIVSPAGYLGTHNYMEE